MDINEIDLVLHEIQQMVSVAISAAEGLGGNEADEDVFQMPAASANLLDFSLFDIDKRLKALREGLDRPAATVVRLGTAA